MKIQLDDGTNTVIIETFLTEEDKPFTLRLKNNVAKSFTIFEDSDDDYKVALVVKNFSPDVLGDEFSVDQKEDEITLEKEGRKVAEIKFQ